MLRKLRFVIAGLAIILANQAVSFAVSAARPEALLPAGSTRYAVVQTTVQQFLSSNAWTNMTGTSTSITIPTGMHGDVMVLFCAVVNTVDFVHIRATIGGAAMGPGETSILGTTGVAQSQCAYFYKGGLTAGTRTVQMQWLTGGGVQSILFGRSMIVIVNVR